MEGGKLICHRGDLFYVTNTDCTLDLTGVSLENLDRKGKLLRVTGNSASRGWGKAGSNGGKAKVTAVGQKLQGDIVVDTISHLDLTLGKGTVFQGAIALEKNPSGTALGSDRGKRCYLEPDRRQHRGYPGEPWEDQSEGA